ncbi:GNAT family N-acetyltransferase [Panacibacter ginsenosidivorans]|uniref:GNAT family N-acetyltransferase n=1 Tax=Panacibacter ginsenosidivorans TaxID=1813871 RepID=A0A5B8V4J5_9BACT|nr:GNAT family N-acetyltransferase [Panacibacter ginsenosidivorans]QEC66109.1 GNAT family N-acetyltransferase [Panacibacter ginsenosidivorans]
MEVKIATNEEDIFKCWDVLFVLRPHLIKEEFVSTVKEMFTEGYQLAYIEENGKAASAIGFRYQQYLYNGKHFYIDDLVSLPETRGKGYAGMLLDYVHDLAKEKGYKYVTLDSGHQRHTAHRLYLNKGYSIVAHHFMKTL